LKIAQWLIPKIYTCSGHLRLPDEASATIMDDRNPSMKAG
jgi:hypothetical protein